MFVLKSDVIICVTFCEFLSLKKMGLIILVELITYLTSAFSCNSSREEMLMQGLNFSYILVCLLAIFMVTNFKVAKSTLN
jgi:hypothetical protein